ncbi:hypothetical protein PG988_001327 [Apiospora saccharicola]
MIVSATTASAWPGPGGAWSSSWARLGLAEPQTLTPEDMDGNCIMPSFTHMAYVQRLNDIDKLTSASAAALWGIDTRANPRGKDDIIPSLPRLVYEMQEESILESMVDLMTGECRSETRGNVRGRGKLRQESGKGEKQ